MTLNLTIPDKNDLRPRITVFGVGGAGGNAVNNMIDKRLDGVEFVVANTDAQALAQSQSSCRIQMGVKVTEGLGAGARPSVGAAAAEETIEEIVDHLAGAHMCFITAGMGGGTGTGAAPIIAQAARELGVLTVGVVTKPFQFEGARRMRQAEEGVEALQKMVDTLIIIPNQNLFRLANEKTTFTEAFSMADDVLYQGVKGVTDLMVRPGLINLDFADVRSVMDEMGKAMMGTGEGEGEDRAIQAAEKAIANPLLDEISLKGAHGVLINITGGTDLTLFELDEAANRIREEVDPDANIIVGSTLDPEMEGRMRVSVVATGIDAAVAVDHAPVRRTMADRITLPPAAEAGSRDAGSGDHDDEEEDRVAMSGSAASQQPSLSQSDAAAGARSGHSYPEPVSRASSQGAQRQAQHQAQREARSQRDAYEEDGEPLLFAEPSAPSFRSERGDASEQGGAQAPARSFEQSFGQSFGSSAATAAPVSASEPPRRAGMPSAETMARLQAAVSKRPDMETDAQTGTGGAQKFGINSLINRMTGHPQDGDRHQAPIRRQPPVQAEPDPRQMSAEEERIEIPAFLRRQAN